MRNRQRMQALFDQVVQAWQVVVLANADGTFTQIPKDRVWAALVAVTHGDTTDPAVTRLMKAAGSNSRVVSMVRIVAKSIELAHSEGDDLTEPPLRQRLLDDSQA